MKKFTIILLAMAMLFLMTSCATKTLHCDNCNAEVKVAENSNMEEDWAIFCESCNEELFADDPLLGAK